MPRTLMGPFVSLTEGPTHPVLWATWRWDKRVQKRVPVRKDRLQAGGPFGTGHAQMKPWLLVFAHGGHPKKENASMNKGGF